MELDSILRRSDDILHAPAGKERAVMMSLQTGSYFGVNAVGARLWELLEAPQTLGALCTRLCDEFEVAPQTCRIEVLEFADKLVACGLLHADPA